MIISWNTISIVNNFSVMWESSAYFNENCDIVYRMIT